MEPGRNSLPFMKFQEVFQLQKDHKPSQALHNAARLYSDLANPLWIPEETQICELTLGSQASLPWRIPLESNRNVDL